MEKLAERLAIEPELCDLWAQLDPATQAATAIVYVCWAGHGWDLGANRRLAMRWWGEFLPERVTLAALTSGTLAEFGAELSRRLKGQIGSRYAEQGEVQRQIWTELIALPEAQQRRILDVLETQASVCVTLIRANQEARKKRGEETNSPGGNRAEPRTLWEAPGATPAASGPEPVPAGAADERPPESEPAF